MFDEGLGLDKNNYSNQRNMICTFVVDVDFLLFCPCIHLCTLLHRPIALCLFWMPS